MQCSKLTKRKHKFERPADWKTPSDDHQSDCHFCLHKEGKSVDTSTMVKPVFRTLKDKVNQTDQLTTNDSGTLPEMKSKIKRSMTQKKLVRKEPSIHQMSPIVTKKPSPDERPSVEKRSTAIKRPTADERPIGECKRKRGRPRKDSSDQNSDYVLKGALKRNPSITCCDPVPKRKRGRPRKDPWVQIEFPPSNKGCECPEFEPEALGQVRFAVTCPMLNVQKDLDELAVNLVSTSRAI